MSRIGNAIIIVPKEVTVSQSESVLVVKGPKGELQMDIPMGITVTATGDTISVTRAHNDGRSRALHGYTRAKLSNLIVGVTKGWTRVLELSGVGYRSR